METAGEQENGGKLMQLYEAAIMNTKEGDLAPLIRTNLGILEETMRDGVTGDSPLHMAAMFGRDDVVKEILNQKAEFAGKLNWQGASPLHLASENGHVNVVKVLLETAPDGPDLCFIRDKDGRTPLHVAAAKGRVKVLKQLVGTNKIAAWMLTGKREPILHLCANHYQFEALVELVNFVDDEEFVKLKDGDGNTILHVLTAMEQFKVIKFLVGKYRTLNVNEMNVDGYTALDVLQKCPGTINPMRIWNLFATHRAQHGRRRHPATAVLQKVRKPLECAERSETREALMVVAILIATVTFTAQMSPPGGVFQEDGHHNLTKPYVNQTTKMWVYNERHLVGEAVIAYKYPKSYMLFTAFNIVGFVASLVLILLLASGLHIRQHAWTRFLRGITCIATASMLVIYGCSFYTTATPVMHDRFRATGVPIMLTGLVALAFVALAVAWYAFAFVSGHGLEIAYELFLGEINQQDSLEDSPV